MEDPLWLVEEAQSAAATIAARAPRKCETEPLLNDRLSGAAGNHPAHFRTRSRLASEIWIRVVNLNCNPFINRDVEVLIGEMAMAQRPVHEKRLSRINYHSYENVSSMLS